MSEPTRVGEDVVRLYAELRAASEARRRWEKHEDDLKAKILEATGFDPNDPRPASMSAVGPDGKIVCEVVVTYRRDVDRRYIKTRYPAVWAEAERDVAVKSIKPPQG